MRTRVFLKLWLPLYVMLLAAIISGLLYGRKQALTIYGSDTAKEEWQEWVSDAREQERKGGPVRRRAPKTDIPPAFVLMRDHAVVSFAAAIVLTSAVYWSFAFLLNGVLSARSSDANKKRTDDPFD